MRRALAVVLGLLAPAAARACAVCGLIGDPNRGSFFWTMVLLSLLPLGMFVGGVLFLRHAMRARLPDEFADPDAARPSPESTPDA